MAVMVAGLAHAADPLEVPRETPGVPFNPAKPGPPPIPFAAGSVQGPWAFLELGSFLGTGTFVEPDYFGYAGLQTVLNAGWGFEVGRVHLRPSMRFGAAYELLHIDAERSRWLVTPIALSLAATNLLDEPHTGLRLTPALGVTIPTLLEPGIPVTTFTLAAQLERRFGPVEVAFRTQVGKPVYVPVQSSCRLCFYADVPPAVAVAWENTIQAEGWILDSLSIGASLGLAMYWRASASSDEYTPQGIDANGNPVASPGLGRRDLTTAHVYVNWAFTRLFGASLDVTTVNTPLFVDKNGVKRVRFPFLSFGSWADNTTTIWISFWFRTDVALARYWIERC